MKRKGAHNWSENCEECSVCGYKRTGSHQYKKGKCKFCGHLENDNQKKQIRKLPPKDEVNSLWQESAAYITMDALLKGREDSLQEYFTRRIDHAAIQCRDKWNLSKKDCIQMIIEIDNIPEDEFNSLYQGYDYLW